MIKENFRTTLLVLLLSCLVGASAVAHNQPKFIENKGQLPEQVRFKLRVSNSDLYFEKDRVTFSFYSPDLVSDEHNHDHDKPHASGGHVYRMNFENSNPDVNIVSAGNTYKDYINYISKEHQISHVKSYNGIKYDEIYDGVDIVYYGNEGHLKYDIILAPNSDPDQIALEYEGAAKVYLKGNKLYVKNEYNTIEESIPLAYQVINGKRVIVECEYSLTDETVGFIFPNGYDQTEELIIDPEIIFISYSGSTSNNFGFTATYDDNGSLYGGGIVFGPGYPYVTGSYSSEFIGMPNLPVVNTNDTLVDIGISKFSPDGTTLLYSTYISGSSAEAPHSLIVNGQGELVILGSTSSPDFPVTDIAHDTTFNNGVAQNYVNNGMNYTNGSDIFVAVLSADGSSLIGSTFLGGSANDGINPSGSLKYNYNDLFRGEVIVDEQDNIFITSTTLSNNFPATIGAYDELLDGTQDAIVAKFNSDVSNLVWCTYLGGTGDDSGYSLKQNANGDIYITGGTTSNDLQMGTSPFHGAFQGGQADGYVFQLSGDGSSMLNATYIGTSVYDQSYFVEVDDDQDVYLFGQTLGAYTVSAGVHSNANGKQFIQKLTPNLSASVYSTVFGSGSSTINISPTAFLVDICERVYISGWGGGTNGGTANGTTLNMEVTNDAEQSTTDGSDFYFMVLDEDATSLLYGSYLGGANTQEHVDGGTSRFDKNGVIYQAVCSSCGEANDFPTTSGAWSEVDVSAQWSSGAIRSGCNLGVIKLAMELSTVDVQINNGLITTGCAPLEVQFEGTITNASEYTWYFHNGDSANVEDPVFTYDTPGVYEALLVGSGTISCTGLPFTDTAVAVITVGELTDAADAGTGGHLCPGDSVQIGANTIPGYTYEWNPTLDLSDPLGPNPYASPTENVQYNLTIVNEDGCEDVDSVFITVFGIDALPDTSLCADDSVQVSVIGGSNFSWMPTAGVSDPASPNPYIRAGFSDTYTVTAGDGLGCEDTAIVNIGFLTGPEALFDVEISQSCLGDSVRFINLSDNAENYEWNIGGMISTQAEPTILFEPGDGPVVLLTAYSQNGLCVDTLTIDYMNGWYTQDSITVRYANVFTPNGDGINDCFTPKYSGELDECFRLRVFSRWGRLLYDTEKHGGICWDGTQRTDDLVSKGTYYYIANVRGMDHAGFVTVLYE